MTYISRLLASFLYTGFIPKAPGTWGSLAGLIIWWFIPIEDVLFQITLILLVFLLGVFVSEYIIRETGEADPQFIVIDEVAGIWLSLLLIPREWHYFLIGFILFRIFDIAKPTVVDRAQRVRDGFGVMLDDMVAGIITLTIMIGLIKIL